jgi:hypothetical protein
LYPVTAEVLACHVKLALCWTGATPVPVPATTGEAFAALLANVTFPEALPLAWGEKVTVKVALWPATSVVGRESPDRTNSVLLEVADEIVTLAPVAVRVLVRFLVAPTVTFPKLRLDGFTLNWPLAVPVPPSAIARLGFGAFDVMFTDPLAVPADLGANNTENVTLCPADSCVGADKPEIENPVPTAAAFVRLMVDPPVLVSVSERLRLLPT